MATLGIVGLGTMGRPMAKNLLQAGHSVKAFDVSSVALDSIVESGGERATQHSVVERVDALITMLPTGQDVADVLDGDNGLFGHAGPDTLFIDSSSIDVDTARMLADRAEQCGMSIVDAPVSGGVAGAKAGTLTFMVGGTKSSFAKVKPILESMGKSIIHAGSSGAGQAAKICNNMMLGIEMIAVAEAFGLAAKLGLDAKTLSDIIASSSGQCWSLTHNHPVRGLTPGAPAEHGYAPGFTSKLMLKDLKLSQNAAQSIDAWTPLGTAATELYQKFVDAGHSDMDFSAIIQMIERDHIRS